MVEEMLARIDPEFSRPVNIGPEFGLHADGYHLSEIQAQRILEMQLQRLTNLESDKIIGEYKEIMAKIADLLDILANPARITQIIREELTQIQEQFGDGRRSAIVENAQDMSMEDLIKPEEMVVTLSHGGYMKSQPIDDYRAQKRGGRGKQAAGTKDEDFIEKMFVANTHDYILCFSNRGRLYWLKVYNVPQGGRARARQAHRQPAAAGRRREDQRAAAGQDLRRRSLRVHGDQQRHRQENAACRTSRVRARPASSRWGWTRAISSSARRSPTAATT